MRASMKSSSYQILVCLISIRGNMHILGSEKGMTMSVIGKLSVPFQNDASDPATTGSLNINHRQCYEPVVSISSKVASVTYLGRLYMTEEMGISHR